ncbi:hypothetical protein C8Q79DRAFT_968830 [Trametes meyenii]|nr:hypothetical protein C8Q79DRAFT_968830 [Trametes meyenii]
MSLTKLTEDFSRDVDPRHFEAVHDGVVHNPLGSAAYLYKEDHLKPILHHLGLIPVPLPDSLSDGIAHDSDTTSVPTRPRADSGISLTHIPIESILTIHIGAQPNNSPHAGTIITFATAFVLARDLQAKYAKLRADAIASSPADTPLWVDTLRVVVQLDLVDTAPDASRTATLDGVMYQYSHRATGAMNVFLPDYYKLLTELREFTGNEVDYVVRNQEELMRRPTTRDAIRTLIRDRARLAAELFPTRNALAIRSACPAKDCGCADKHGVRNVYTVTPSTTSITFHCPTHGPYTLTLEDPDDLARLELNTPLRNLARAIVYMTETAASRTSEQPTPAALHMRVTGADYSGEYQERTFFHQLSELKKVAEPRVRDAVVTDPVIVYAPLILDWSGAKLSKSLYVKQDGYKYLRAQGKDYFLEFRRMGAKDRKVLYGAVEDWFRQPAKRFRSYSLEYLHLLLIKAGLRGDQEVRKGTASNARDTGSWLDADFLKRNFGRWIGCLAVLCAGLAIGAGVVGRK